MDMKKITISNRNKKRLFWAIASVVVFVTTYMLVLPALTIDEETALEDPAISNETLSQEQTNELETVADPFTIEQEREQTLNNSEESNVEDPSSVDPVNTQDTIQEENILSETYSEEINLSGEEGETESSDIEAVTEEEVIASDKLVGEGDTLKVSILNKDSLNLPEDAVLEVKEIRFDDPQWNSRSFWLASALSEKYGNVTISDARFLSVRVICGEQEYRIKSPVTIQVEFKEKMYTEDTAEYYYDEEAGRELRPDPEDQVSHFAVINYTDEGTEFLETIYDDSNDGIEQSTFEIKDLSKIDIVYDYEYTASLAD